MCFLHASPALAFFIQKHSFEWKWKISLEEPWVDVFAHSKGFYWMKIEKWRRVPVVFFQCKTLDEWSSTHCRCCRSLDKLGDAFTIHIGSGGQWVHLKSARWNLPKTPWNQKKLPKHPCTTSKVSVVSMVFTSLRGLFWETQWVYSIFLQSHSTWSHKNCSLMIQERYDSLSQQKHTFDPVWTCACHCVTMWYVRWLNTFNLKTFCSIIPENENHAYSFANITVCPLVSNILMFGKIWILI